MSAAQEQSPVAEVSSADDLAKEKGRFRETWVHPDADIIRSHKLYLWSAVFRFRGVGDKKTPRTTVSVLSSIGTEYPVAKESREKKRGDCGHAGAGATWPQDGAATPCR